MGVNQVDGGRGWLQKRPILNKFTKAAVSATDGYCAPLLFHGFELFSVGGYGRSSLRYNAALKSQEETCLTFSFSFQCQTGSASIQLRAFKTPLNTKITIGKYQTTCGIASMSLLDPRPVSTDVNPTVAVFCLRAILGRCCCARVDESAAVALRPLARHGLSEGRVNFGAVKEKQKF